MVSGAADTRHGFDDRDSAGDDVLHSRFIMAWMIAVAARDHGPDRFPLSGPGVLGKPLRKAHQWRPDSEILSGASIGQRGSRRGDGQSAEIAGGSGPGKY